MSASLKSAPSIFASPRSLDVNTTRVKMASRKLALRSDERSSGGVRSKASEAELKGVEGRVSGLMKAARDPGRRDANAGK